MSFKTSQYWSRMPTGVWCLIALVLTSAGMSLPARADFFDDVRRTFQKDIPRTFEEDIPRFFGADPKKPPRPPNQDKAVKQPSAEPRR